MQSKNSSDLYLTCQENNLINRNSKNFFLVKSFFITIVMYSVVISCNDKTKKREVEKEPSYIINTIEDPNIFIGKNKAKAMVLGVFHFHNPNLDSYKPKYPFNILDDKRQAELDTLLKKIAAYKPTKILIELPRITMDSIINKRYKNYLQGSFPIDSIKNEVYQIGFQLAKKLEHPRVYCSDAISNWCGVELDWDNYDEDSYLKSRGQFDKFIRYNYTSFYEFEDSIKTKQTLTAYLYYMNKPENRLKDHQAYLTQSVLVGAGDNYLGADGVAGWYRRNLRIFSNAYDVTDFDKNERLLLIYGAGHVWQLRQFFKDSPDFDYVEPNNYLSD